MKPYLLYLLAWITCFSLASCNFLESDPCNLVICANGGFCEDGSCLCPEGYEAADCSLISRDKFIQEYEMVVTDHAASHNIPNAQITEDASSILNMKLEFVYASELISIDLLVTDSLEFDLPDQMINGFLPAQMGDGYIDSTGMVYINAINTDGNAYTITYELTPQ